MTPAQSTDYDVEIGQPTTVSNTVFWVSSVNYINGSHTTSLVATTRIIAHHETVSHRLRCSGIKHCNDQPFKNETVAR
jgi:hypothetical protein